MNSEQNEPTRVVGAVTVFLRPLRYMFDVETDVAVVCEEKSTPVLPFESVHVHVRAAKRPPLMERDQLLNGFLRAETPIHSSAALPHRRLSSDIDKYKVDLDSEEGSDAVESGEGEIMLSSLRGTYVWILVRLQPLARSTSTFPLIIPNAEVGKGALRVQYQISTSSESFCLPIDHTNVSANPPFFLIAVMGAAHSLHYATGCQTLSNR